MDEMYDVFLSHNSADKPAVELIGQLLEDRGLRVWLDKWNLIPGDPWQEAIEAALKCCRSCAVFVGAEGVGPWHNAEMRRAIARRVQKGSAAFRAIPVVLPGMTKQQCSDLPGFLTDATWVQFTHPVDRDDDALHRLVCGIQGIAPGRSPTASPSKPAARPIGPHNLPFASIESLFVGREQTLDELREKLAAAPAASIVARQAIHGLGGVGKSRLAVEYAWRHAADYAALLFVCGGLAERVGGTVRRARAAGAGGPRGSGAGRGHVLITSRRSHWPPEVAPLELDVLAEADAVAFLLARTADSRQAEPDDKQAAAELAKELGCLALALEQAAAYIGRRHQRLRDYLRHWRDLDAQVRQWFDPLVTPYARSIATTWQSSIEMLSEPGRELLQTLCWLSPEPIPLRLLNDPRQEAAADLSDYSLVRWESEEEPALRMHRLVQDVTRRSIPEEERVQWIERALRLLNAALPSGDAADVRTWPAWEPLRPHVAFTADEADRHGIAEPTSRLMGYLGTLLSAKALHAAAEQLKRRALAIDERHFGRDSTQVALRLNNLAQTLQDTNRLAEAEPLMRRALAIDEQSYGAKHPRVAIDLNNLATLLQAKTEEPDSESRATLLAEAEPLMRRHVEIFVNFGKSTGHEHPHMQAALQNYRNLLRALKLSEEEIANRMTRLNAVE